MSATRLCHSLKNLAFNNYKPLVFKKNNSIQSFNKCIQICSVIRFKSQKTFLDSYNEDPEKKAKKSKGLVLTKDGKEVKKLTLSDSKIVLINLDNTKSYLYLGEAEKLAKRNRCKIEFINEKIGQKDVYKLIKGVPEKSKSDDKNYKNLIIGTKITDYDLDVKLKLMLRVVEKGKSIKITIEEKSTDDSNLETLFKKIESKLVGTNTQILQKSKSSKKLNFVVAPMKEKLDGNNNVKKEISKNDGSLKESMANDSS